MPTAAELVWVRGFCRRGAVLVALVAVVALAAAAWATWRLAGVRPADGPVLVRVLPGRGVHAIDLVGSVASLGTALGVVAAATGAVVRAHRPGPGV